MALLSGTITGVEQQRRQRGRVNIYLDNRFAFSLSAIVAESATLKNGAHLSREQVEDLLSRDQFQKALDSALRFLSYRPRSEKEIRGNLARKGFPEPFVARIIQRLKELELIDDAAFARFWVQNRDTHSPRSHRALKFELRGKGVETDILDEAIADAADQEEGAIAAARKKLRSLQYLEYQEFRQKLGAYLGRRGYDYDTIRTVVDALWRETLAQQSAAQTHDQACE